jgi:5-methylcytosine-specific restriction endonuclease McrA
MIKLSKCDLPESISEKIRERTERFAILLAAGEPIPEALASAYKSPEVKELLRRETADKCVYCESKVPHVDHGDVEHLRPKSIFPELRFSYENLTFSCGVCNTKKGDFYCNETPLLNPYEDLPEEHLMPVGPMVLRAPASDRGLITQKRLDLNRTKLVERRQERLEAIATLLDQVARTQSAAIRAVLLDQVDQECSADKEYCFVVRAYVTSVRDSLR